MSETEIALLEAWLNREIERSNKQCERIKRKIEAINRRLKLAEEAQEAKP